MTTVPEAVATATASVTRLYALGSVPPKPTYPYGVQSSSLGRGDAYTLDAVEGLRWGRIVVQTFGKTQDSAVALAEQARGELVGSTLAVTGYATTPIRAELDPQIGRDPDDNGVVDVTATYVFTATQE